MTGPERSWSDDIAEAGRRDAECDGEFASQPDCQRGEPWWQPNADDRADMRGER